MPEFLDIPSSSSRAAFLGLHIVDSNYGDEIVPEGSESQLSDVLAGTFNANRLQPSQSNLVEIKPIPGFVLKTFVITGSKDGKFPASLKVFLNICNSVHVPEPDGGINPNNAAIIIDLVQKGGHWEIPVVVSEERWDQDKSGKRCIVFDCTVNTGVFLICTTNHRELKALLLETCLELIENATGTELSRGN